MSDQTTSLPSDTFQQTSRRPVKVTYLVIGLLFLGIAGIWVLGATDTVEPHQAALGFPGVLIAAGVVGLFAALANGRTRTRRQRPMASADPIDTDPISEEENQ